MATRSTNLFKLAQEIKRICDVNVHGVCEEDNWYKIGWISGGIEGDIISIIYEISKHSQTLKLEIEENEKVELRFKIDDATDLVNKIKNIR